MSFWMCGSILSGLMRQREVSETGLFPLRGSVRLIICADTAGDVSNYESKLARNDRIDTLEQEISTETEKLLEGLKEEERQILLRYYAEEDDVDVLAKEYGVSSSTIYSKVSRAKKKVRKNHGRLEEHV